MRAVGRTEEAQVGGCTGTTEGDRVSSDGIWVGRVEGVGEYRGAFASYSTIVDVLNAFEFKSVTDLKLDKQNKTLIAFNYLKYTEILIQISS